MTLTVDQQAAVEKPVVSVAYFAFFDFAGAAVRVTNFNQSFNWGGYEWAGVGALGSISQVTETESIESSPLNFTLNVADPSVIAAAVGPVEEYRGRNAKLYMCPLNPDYSLIDEPVICWSGVMDMMSLGVSAGDGSGNIVLKCETAAYALKRQPALRMNDAQQQKRHPGDTGFSFLSDILASPAVWLSRRFQQI